MHQNKTKMIKIEQKKVIYITLENSFHTRENN